MFYSILNIRQEILGVHMRFESKINLLTIHSSIVFALLTAVCFVSQNIESYACENIKKCAGFSQFGCGNKS